MISHFKSLYFHTSVKRHFRLRTGYFRPVAHLVLVFRGIELACGELPEFSDQLGTVSLDLSAEFSTGIPCLESVWVTRSQVNSALVFSHVFVTTWIHLKKETNRNVTQSNTIPDLGSICSNFFNLWTRLDTKGKVILFDLTVEMTVSQGYQSIEMYLLSVALSLLFFHLRNISFRSEFSQLLSVAFVFAWGFDFLGTMFCIPQAPFSDWVRAMAHGKWKVQAPHGLVYQVNFFVIASVCYTSAVWTKKQGCHMSWKSQGKTKFSPGQGIVREFWKNVREIWLFDQCQGIVREFSHDNFFFLKIIYTHTCFFLFFFLKSYNFCWPCFTQYSFPLNLFQKLN